MFIPTKLASAVRRRPRTVILVTLIVSVALGYFAGQAEREDQVQVETRRSQALETLEQRFGDDASVMQVLIRSGDDIRSADGLRASLDIQETITRSDLADTLVDGQQPPPIVSFLSGAEELLEHQPYTASELTDEQVRDLSQRASERLPEEVTALLAQLIPDRDPAHTGLILIFQDTTGLDEEQQLEQQAQLARLVLDVNLPDDITAEPFSFGLLMERDGDVGAEVSRLFLVALAAVLLVLALVYWRPTRGRAGPRLRRTAADVGLTLSAIVLAVVWMQGSGVLLGPDYLGLVGYFSPSSQIVPILIVGLGVDFAIHLLARYRTERRRGADTEQATVRAIITVGVALTLGALATATGFLTNMTSPLDFLAMLGVLAAIGVLAAFVLATTFLPAARLLLDRHADRRRDRDRTVHPLAAGPEVVDAETRAASASRFGVGAAAWLAERAPLPTLLVATAIAGVGAFGATQLDSSFDVTDFVPRGEPMLASHQTLAEEFAGGFDGQVEILLAGDLRGVDAHNALVTTHEELTEISTLSIGPGGVTSPASVLQQAHDRDELSGELATRGVDSDGMVTADTDLHDLYQFLAEQGVTDEVVDLTGDEPIGRIVLDSPVPPGSEDALLTELHDILEPLAAHGIEAVATSQELVEHDLTEAIADSQLTSLLLALAAATALLSAHYAITRRRALLGALTVLPAALVVTVTLAAMAATGIPLNPVTATLAALSIGIAVPFTIHITNRYLEERDHEDGPAGAVRRTLDGTGAALTASAATTAIGFGVLTTSSLLPFRQLGQVTLFAIGAALAAAILVLPSILTLWERRQPSPCDGDPAPETEPVHIG